MKAIIASEKGGLGADSPALMADRESIMRPAWSAARVVCLVSCTRSVLCKYGDTVLAHRHAAGKRPCHQQTQSQSRQPG